MANKNTMDKTSKTTKTWEYSQGHMNLKFDVSVDVKTDMVDFLECLKAAVSDLEEEIKNYGNS